MTKSKKAREEQFKQVDFFPDTYKIVIQPPTFKSLNQAFSYFVQHHGDFVYDDEGDGNEVPVSVESPILDVHDSIDYFEDRLRQQSQFSNSEPTSEGESAESVKFSSTPSARETERGGEEERKGAAGAAPDTQ